MGRRLGKYTRDNTKCMLPVNGVRLIDRMLEQLCQLNLSRLVLVVGYKGKELKDYIGDRYEDRLHVTVLLSPGSSGTRQKSRNTAAGWGTRLSKCWT